MHAIEIFVFIQPEEVTVESTGCFSLYHIVMLCFAKNIKQILFDAGRNIN